MEMDRPRRRPKRLRSFLIKDIIASDDEQDGKCDDEREDMFGKKMIFITNCECLLPFFIFWIILDLRTLLIKILSALYAVSRSQQL